MVELRGVTKRFAARTAVDAVSLEVPRGQFFSLLGPSGCGKTTTLRLIAGFEQPDQGEVRIHGVCVNDLPPYRRKVSTVFQSYALFPHLTVAGNIEFGLRRAGTPETEMRRRLERVLELVQLPGYAGRRPDLLSGGEKQRVALARSLVLEPDVLLLDEPLAALDQKLRREVRLELKRLQRAVGITFLFVTHDQEEALTLSDRIAVMYQGRLEQVGTPEEIYRRPQTEFVAGFIGNSNLIPCRVTAAPAGWLELSTGGGQKLLAPCPASTPPAGTSVTLLVRPEAVQLADGRPREEMQMLSGNVLQSSFLGSHHQVTVEVEPGLRITVQAPAGPAPVAGQGVELCWPTAEGLVLHS